MERAGSKLLNLKIEDKQVPGMCTYMCMYIFAVFDILAKFLVCIYMFAMFDMYAYLLKFWKGPHAGFPVQKSSQEELPCSLLSTT